MKSDKDPPYMHLMGDVFFASFSDVELSPDDEGDMWYQFAPKDKEGVRLELEITAHAEDFRKVVYSDNENDKTAVVSEIAELLKSKYNKHFFMKGLSRMCCFYLRNDLSHETEYRLLYRNRWDGSEDRKKEFLELPIGKMSDKYGYKIEVLSVCSSSPLACEYPCKFIQR